VPEGDPRAEATFQEIQTAIELEHGAALSLLDVLRGRDDGVRGRRRLLTGCFFQLAQCFSGSTVISFYVQPIFQDSIGLDNGLASLMSGYLQIWFLVASLGTWWLVEVRISLYDGQTGADDGWRVSGPSWSAPIAGGQRAPNESSLYTALNHTGRVIRSRR
jgi:hypothetical protein